MQALRMTGFTLYMVLTAALSTAAGAQSGPQNENKTGERHNGPPQEHRQAPQSAQPAAPREHGAPPHERAPQSTRQPADHPREAAPPVKQRATREAREPRGQAAQKPVEKARPAPDRPHPQPAQKPAESGREAKAPAKRQPPAAAPAENHPQPVRSREQARQWQQQKAWVKPGAWRGGQSWQQARAGHWESEHRSWAQRGGYGGYVIPQETFITQFGVEHPFYIRSRPVIYLGFPRFYYASYSFIIVDPWPEYWEETWYDDDDVYVIYDDGYYLYSRRDPGIRLAISIVL